MLGVIKKYNFDLEYGYILGADEEEYLFFKDSVKDNILIKEGYIVKFNPLFEKDNLAIDIQIISNI